MTRRRYSNLYHSSDLMRGRSVAPAARPQIATRTAQSAHVRLEAGQLAPSGLLVLVIKNERCQARTPSRANKQRLRRIWLNGQS